MVVGPGPFSQPPLNLVAIPDDNLFFEKKNLFTQNERGCGRLPIIPSGSELRQDLPNRRFLMVDRYFTTVQTASAYHHPEINTFINRFEDNLGLNLGPKKNSVISPGFISKGEIVLCCLYELCDPRGICALPCDGRNFRSSCCKMATKNTGTSPDPSGYTNLGLAQFCVNCRECQGNAEHTFERINSIPDSPE
jgi:hypothetical protein